jgi:hypothetical protein
MAGVAVTRDGKEAMLEAGAHLRAPDRGHGGTTGGQDRGGVAPPDLREGAAMTVMQTTVTRSKPGRRHDAIALALEASKLLERHGASDSRFLVAQIAGEGTGSNIFTTEFDNGEAWGEFNDSLNADAELEALMSRVDRDDSPVVMLSMSVGTTIDLGRSGSTERGAYIEAYISRANPGRFIAALELGATVFDFVERCGATNCRLSQLSSAGMLTECLVASWELDSMKSLGRLGDAFGTEAEGQRIMEILTASDGPITPVTSGIYSEIPL